MTASDKFWHATYEELDADARELIDAGFNQFFATLVDAHFVALGDDRAECLIGAMTKYFVQSNPSFLPPGY